MTRVVRSPIPQPSFLSRYENDANYVDCYSASLPFVVTHEHFVRAFYTTRLFKLERLILHWRARKRSSDADVMRLAMGEADAFAGWQVEARAWDELLLCDFLGNTRSWLKTESTQEGTRLYFGSAVLARARDENDGPVLDSRFRALLGFHQRYSVALLRAAVRRLTALR